MLWLWGRERGGRGRRGMRGEYCLLEVMDVDGNGM